MEEVALKVYGEVQGIGFRYETRARALELQLTGWVKNAPDETVEILAQGEKKNLDKLIAWANHGPSFATVEKVEIVWRRPKEIFETFTVQY